MTSFPGSPKTLRGGFVVMDAEGKAIERIVAFQYNPDSLSRSLTPRGARTDLGDRLEALRLTGSPVETLKLEIELDAVDRLEKPDQNPTTIEEGLAADLAELETLIAPKVADLAAAQALADQGTIEILPLPSPLLLIVLGKGRIWPVRIADFSVVEDAFDVNLNPIRAHISLGMRVLSTEDLSWGSKGAALFRAAQDQRETRASRRKTGLQVLGLTAIP